MRPRLTPKAPGKSTKETRYSGRRTEKPVQDTADGSRGTPPGCPYAAAGHNAIFTGPDGRGWIVCHYQETDKPDSLGFDPIWIEDGVIKTNGPTWTEQTIEI